MVGLWEGSWAKFRPIVELYRGTDFGTNSFSNWKYLAEALRKKRVEQEGDSWAYVDSLWEGSTYK